MVHSDRSFCCQVKHISNAVIPACTIVPVSQVVRQPLAFLATQIRHSLAQQRIPEQVEAWYSMVTDRLKRGLFPLIGTSDGFTTTYTNWDKAGLFRLDLSPAVTQQGLPLDQRTNKIGYPSCDAVVSTGISYYGTRNTVGRPRSYYVIPSCLSVLDNLYGHLKRKSAC